MKQYIRPATEPATVTLSCGHAPSPHGPHTTGYGITQTGARFCYDCCAYIEKSAMMESGRTTLYLSKNKNGDWDLTDWSGHLSFPVRTLHGGRHNIARTRYDVWFKGPDGMLWHGVQYGEWTQLCHCKRTRKAA